MSPFLFPEAECFRTIIADPPWLYGNYGQKKHGSPKPHYPGMTVEAIAAIPVARWAAEDSVLALWTTWPHLEDGLALLAAWGFSYCTGLPWVKTTPSSGEIRCGIGFWTQSASELVLIARAGALAREADAPRVRGLLVGGLEGERVLWAPIGSKHSEKPLNLHEWLEATLPGPRLELFGRAERAGWTVWGNELGFELGPWGVRPCTPFVPTSSTPAEEVA